MTKGTGRCRRNRKLKSGNGTWFSDEMLYAFTRGLSAPRRDEEHGPQVTPCAPDDAAERPPSWFAALAAWWRQ